METYLKELESALSGVAAKLKEEIGAVRSNRPSVQLVEDVKVEYYGQQMAVNSLASLSIRPPRDILVTPWDQSALPAVAKAIETAKMGLSVSVDGSTVRVSLPPLTNERRAELTKLVKRMAEDARIAVRGHREDVIKKVRAAQDAKQLSEDQVFKGKDQIQKIVDGTNQKIEAVLEAKLGELEE